MEFCRNKIAYSVVLYSYLEAISFEIFQWPLDGLFPLLIEDEICVRYFELAAREFCSHLEKRNMIFNMISENFFGEKRLQGYLVSVLFQM